MGNKFINTIASAAKDAASFVGNKGAELSEKKKHWYIILNEGLDGAWKDNSQNVIGAAMSLNIDCAHVVSGAGDISAVGAYCNNEELLKLLAALGIDIENVKVANAGEAQLFKHNLIRR